MDTSIVLKIISVGNSGVGKSSIGDVFNSREFGSVCMTIGIDFFTKCIVVENNHTKLQVWDSAGQERFGTIYSTYYIGANCCLLCFSVDDEQSFSDLDKWKREIEQKTTDLPIILVGNKIDILQEKHLITKDMAEEWCKKQNTKFQIPYFETSAKNSTNINQVFYEAGTLGLHHKMKSNKPNK
ncbi:hypothetical protein RB653_003480 [Dictyostelium firmibasis]|uniref:Uncharacterized protein n=1 Tax=Dictyostelium firmibasis TaxID=79012 RepID=A0AAN7Z2J4_9MYCE